MNGLVSGYGSDSEEEDPTSRPSCLGPAPQKDNGAVKSSLVKSTEKGVFFLCNVYKRMIVCKKLIFCL